jgi:hypothetical protein
LAFRANHGDALSSFSPTAPLFLGADGERITRGTPQYRILRAFKKAGINGERASRALVHGLRHTFATELANANASVYTLMKLLGHESMVTSQRYVDGAGTETRAAAGLNPRLDRHQQIQRIRHGTPHFCLHPSDGGTKGDPGGRVPEVVRAAGVPPPQSRSAITLRVARRDQRVVYSAAVILHQGQHRHSAVIDQGVADARAQPAHRQPAMRHG